MPQAAKPHNRNRKKKRLSRFLALPREIRDEIYYYALDWPNLNNVFKALEEQEKKTEEEHDKLHKSQPRCRIPRPHPQLQTPGLLLVNRQLYTEAIDVLRQKPLIIPGPPPRCYATGFDYGITEVVGEETLQHAPHLTLEIDFLYWPWDHVLETLLDVWSVKQSLKMLVVRVSKKLIAGHVALDLPPESPKYQFSPSRHGYVHATTLSRLLHLSYDVPITMERLEGELFDYRMVNDYTHGVVGPYHSLQ
ncbi:uncharacterized protein BDZ99DRAFT_522691 [Mytilinidion resinicola]|uniref:F-box domain-containing protein n=1 Tax=Mytilinidion resinicola TaxID=574789 RepID=A0A6A6YHN9_9PEZI|nr:uncharacterized protein BDZ99DRAFT_522691 [Mytilinidion resinicola]KAF2808098.1 hypothetical protein BDZ99DRAFT_522691 [Mytilinidion resinicola]